MTHWTAFAGVMLFLLIPIGQHGLFRPSLAFLLSLATAMAFLWLAGRRYRHRLHSYLLLASGTLGTILGYAWMFSAPPAPLSAPWLALLSDSGLGLTFVLVSLAWCAIAWTLTRRLNRMAISVDVAPSLYGQPLRIVAAWLALAAAGQQLCLVWPAVSGAAYTGGFFTIGVLGLAGMSLLLTNHTLGRPLLSLAGMWCVVLAVLWAQGVQVHGSPVCTLWFGHPPCTDHWLVLALVALGLGCLGHSIGRDPRWYRLYTQPLHAVAGLTYGWALLGAGVLFVSLPMQAPAALPWVFGVLAVALIPVAQPLRMASAVRGLGIAVLLTASVISVLTLGGWSGFDRFLLVMWAYALWGVGNMVAPRFNVRWPRWTLAPEPWPWLGLVLIGVAFILWGVLGQIGSAFDVLRLGWYLTAATFYLVLMLRNSAWSGFPWLAVLTLMSTGIAFGLAWLFPAVDVIIPLRFVLGTVVWANVLLLGVSMWRRYGTEWSARLRWPSHDVVTPLLMWPSVWVHLWVALLALMEAVVILLPITEMVQWSSAVLTGGVLTLSCFHILWLRRNAWHSHLGMAALLCTLLAAWLGTAARLFYFPLFLALWSVMLLLLDIVGTHRPWRDLLMARMRQSCSIWLAWSPLAAVVVWILLPQPLGERLLTLGIIGGVMACLGWRRQHPGWWLAAMAILVVQLHMGWLFYIPLDRLVRLMPWYALQLAGLTWAALWLRCRMQDAVEQALSWLLRPLAVLAPLAWAWHALYVCVHLLDVRPPPWLMGSGEVIVAIAALLLLIALGIRQVRLTQRASWVYGVTVLGAALAMYIRMVWIGLAPVQVWDTVGLIGAAYALFILQRLTLSRPILHVVMVLPLLAVGTVPLQFASPHASGALLTVGILYLLARRAARPAIPSRCIWAWWR